MVVCGVGVVVASPLGGYGLPQRAKILSRWYGEWQHCSLGGVFGS